MRLFGNNAGHHYIPYFYAYCLFHTAKEYSERDPVTFIKLYNKAAEQSDDEYVFSSEFIGNID
jgi:TPR repeat protein